MAENFRTQILNNKEAASVQTPVRTLGSVTFMYLRHSDIYLLMATRNNASAMVAFSFMTSVRHTPLPPTPPPPTPSCAREAREQDAPHDSSPCAPAAFCAKPPALTRPRHPLDPPPHITPAD